jgi:hypothetical protein
LLNRPCHCRCNGSECKGGYRDWHQWADFIFYRYSNSGSLLIGPANPEVSAEFLDCITADANGRIYGVGHFLSTYEPFSLSGLSFSSSTVVQTTSAQLKQATDIEFMWDHRLLITSHALSGNGLTGALEFNPSTMTFVQNLIPVSATYLGFNPQESNRAGFRTGTLYVGNDSGTTERYRLTNAGAITKDASFSITTIGNTHFRSGDNTIFMQNGLGGDSILRFDAASGAPLGTFLTLPGGIYDFAFGEDNSAYVLGGSGQSFGLYRYNADGTNPILLIKPFGGLVMAYTAPVPEPATLALMLCGLYLLLRRSAGKHNLDIHQGEQA